MPRVCGFDANETLSDLRALAPHLGRIFSGGTIHWRRLSRLLPPVLNLTATDDYSDPGGLATLPGDDARVAKSGPLQEGQSADSRGRTAAGNRRHARIATADVGGFRVLMEAQPWGTAQQWQRACYQYAACEEGLGRAGK